MDAHLEHHRVPLVDREHELATAERALERLEKERSGVLTIGGELGIGKTRLGREIQALAEQQAALALWGRATRLEPAPPFGPIVDALDGYLGSLDPKQLPSLVGHWRAPLEETFPALGAWARPSSSDGGRAGAEVHQAVAGLLERVAERQPLVLILDDLQWADYSSLLLLARLVREPPRAPVLLVLICRSGQLPRPLAESVDATRGEGRLTEIQLPALTEEQIETLVAGTTEADGLDFIHRESGGNPFYALELARASRGEENGGSGTVPSAVLAAIAEDVASHSPQALAVLHAGTVLGDMFDTGLAIAVADVHEDDAPRAVCELVRRGHFDAGLPTLLLFRRPIVRRALYEGMGLASRLAAHERAARLLAERGGSLTARAHHVEHRGRSTEEDVALLVEAAESTSISRPPVAARWFSAALRRMPYTDERRLTTLLQASASLLAAGRIAEAREAFDKAGAMLPGFGLDSAPTLAGLARIEHLLGLTGPGRSLLRRALDLEQDERSETVLRVALGVDHWRTGEGSAMASQARLAVAAAQKTGDDGLRANAAALSALAEYLAGRVPPALAKVAEAERLVGTLPDEGLASQLECLLFLGYVNHGLERFASAAQHFDRGIRLARASGNIHFVVLLTVGLAAGEFATGRLRQAERRAAVALEMASGIGNPQLLMWVHALRSQIATLRGELVTAVEAAEHAASAAEGVASGFLTAAAQCALGLARMEAGHSHGGPEHVLRHAGGPGLDRLDAGLRPGCYAALARFERMQGRLDLAEEWLARAEASAAGLGLPGRTATVRRGRARLILERDPAAAARLAMEAADAFAEVDQRVESARSLSVAGRAQAMAGDEARGKATLERAVMMLAECGAERHYDAAARELRRLGATVKRRPRRGGAASGIGALARREREVAELVARGHTNRRIAEELFVSQRTVEDHLARVFAKLGVASRAGVAAAVEGARAAAAGRA